MVFENLPAGVKLWGCACLDRVITQAYTSNKQSTTPFSLLCPNPSKHEAPLQGKLAMPRTKEVVLAEVASVGVHVLAGPHVCFDACADWTSCPNTR